MALTEQNADQPPTITVALDVLGVEIEVTDNLTENNLTLLRIRDIVDNLMSVRDGPVPLEGLEALQDIVAVFMPAPTEPGARIEVLNFLFPNTHNDEIRRTLWPHAIDIMRISLVQHLHHRRVMRETVNDAPPQPTASAAECKRLVATRFDADEGWEEAQAWRRSRQLCYLLDKA